MRKNWIEKGARESPIGLNPHSKGERAAKELPGALVSTRIAKARASVSLALITIWEKNSIIV